MIVDLRPGSTTFLRWHAETLTPENGKMMYAPKGFAHGFITLEPQTEIFYQMSQFYAPESSRGIRWNDPRIGIEWPRSVEVISEKDRSLPDYASGQMGEST